MFTQMANWKHLSSGKVRDLYLPDGDHPLGDVVMIVASNRISAFDHILSSEIPNKGSILTQMSILWLEQLAQRLEIPHHFLTQDGVPPEVAGRAMICQNLDMIAVECVARGYLTGSAYKEYARTGKYQEYQLDTGLTDGSKFAKALFTPAMKAELGEHDENVTFAEVSANIGEQLASQLRKRTLEIYEFAAETCAKVGVTLVDTKFEFGINPQTGILTLGDEVLTPDSSRYWDNNCQNFDKQIVRNWLENESGWDARSQLPPPPLPDQIIEQVTTTYSQLFELLKGAI
jgi:phosphoribosylaminoimidazole-succinocarboxamide synthase